jgi:hypothetical protein
VRLALMARERDMNWNDTSALSCGLEDIANHLWPKEAAATTQRNGVTLANAGEDTQDATPERLAQAGEAQRLDDKGVRRLNDSPFGRMHARGQLDPDSGINDILYSAGRNYHQDWYYSGLGGISGIDYSRVGSGGGTESSPAYMMPRSEFALGHRLQFRKAREALGERYRPVADAVVLEERGIPEIAYEISGYKGPDAGSAATRERLNTALRRLAVFYGLMRSPSEEAAA